ncbi:Serine/Threonine kinase domain protein (macronuclear) [Tetrahymena thermophila SB210]|uniref:Serine/Threonine kinase domain protein n=1 Tax=Tetrahymena thermophila (strain SB210) TaxID=312017 RepID=I7M9Q0_TETTS|nr:Serine/Threonine kinase domain protein [Tetrahymena thermophila SB210]EAS02451.2 Serine/Threonine kinase domain protein [Tetrahymena thermophila SB210]|eukprot:XP_001022696.2 Serine/Threonine kinase domain protein [Tetrahymena thermophila SB210]
MDKAEGSNAEMKPNLVQGLDILTDQNADLKDKHQENERSNNQNLTQDQHESIQQPNSTSIKNAQVQEKETSQHQKKQAMNRMRNSIKETLFKGITKKINPEGSSQSIAPQNSGSQNNVQQLFSQSGILGKGSNFNEQDQQIQNQAQKLVNDENQIPQEDEDLFKLQTVLTNSVKIEQCPRIEFNFTGSNNSNKVRMNDPIINKIFEEQKPQKDSSIINQTRIFEENYELIGEKLGEGSQGDVRKCIHKKSQQVYAVKMIRNGDTEIILSAITSFKIAKNLNHPSIIKPYELFINQETEKIYYVMEYCEYGSLQDYIENLWSLSPHKRDHRSMSKMKTTSTDNLEDESNSLDSQKNLNFEGASNKATKKKDRKKKQKKRRQEDNQAKEDDHLIKLYQQLGSSDNLKQQQNEIVNNNLNAQDEDDTKIDSQKKIEGSEEKSVRNKSQKRKVQFNSSYQSKIDHDLIKRILKEIITAVEYLHSEGICHRDLKPDNILISNDLQNIKIIDFEISKRFKYFRQNKTGVLKVCEMWTRTGTLDFQSPEMFESAGYTEAVDIWAIGVIAYYLLTGRLPFDQEYISDKIEFIRNAQYNQDYIKDLDDISKDFIRRMLRKDPAERLTASEALSHPWFLVCSNNDVRNRNELNLNMNKSTVLNLFHSPQDSDKGCTIDSKKYMELSLIKANQSTVLVKKDSNGSDSNYPNQLTFAFTNKMQSQKYNNSNNYSLRIKNHHNKIQLSNRFEGSADNLQMKNEDSPVISESSKHIVEKKRNSRPHNTQIESPTKSRNNQNGDQYFKQSGFFGESVQKCFGDNSCKVYKSNIQGSNINVSQFREDIFNIKEVQCGENSCTNIPKNQMNTESEYEDESEKDDSLLRKKKEYKMKLQQFKQLMTTGMQDLPTNFIHINQKQQKTPQTSQLRLRLLYEKSRIPSEKAVFLKNEHQQQQQQQQQQLQYQIETNKQPQSVLQNSQHQIISTQQNTLGSNMSVFNSTQNYNSNTNSQVSGGHSSNLCSPIQYTDNIVNANPSTNLLQFQLNPTNLSNNNNNSNNNSTFANKNEAQVNLPSQSSINNTSNIFSGAQLQEGIKSIQLQQHQSNQSAVSAGAANPVIQHFIDNSEIEVQGLRSRSNTNDVAEKVESEEQIDTRAKRMSEDFTSSCIVQNPERQQAQPVQNYYNLNSSQKNGNFFEAKVQKSSHFSNNQYTLASNINSENLIPSQGVFSNDHSKQFSIQEQLQMKSTKYVKQFLLSTGNMQEQPSSQQQIQSKESVGNLETSINPIFKKIESDDDTPQNEQAVKKGTSLNSSNLWQFQNGLNRSNSDICSIASDFHINHNDILQKDNVKIDHTQLGDIIQSSSEESFQIDDNEDFQNVQKTVQVQPH